MRSRKVVLGALAFVLLAVAAVVLLALGHEVAALAAVVLMLAGIGVLLLGVTTTLRRTERQLKKLGKATRNGAAPAPAAPVFEGGSPAASEADLMGTVRLLQAQYVSRLDRAERMLETAVRQLSDDRGN